MDKLTITIKHLNLTGSSNFLYDICGICRVNILNNCNKCSDDIKCYSIVGVCNHAFHYCCITDWINTQNKKICPMCNQKWDIKKKHI